MELDQLGQLFSTWMKPQIEEGSQTNEDFNLFLAL